MPQYDFKCKKCSTVETFMDYGEHTCACGGDMFRVWVMPYCAFGHWLDHLCDTGEFPDDARLSDGWEF